jgi:hypothetical protein
MRVNFLGASDGVVLAKTFEEIAPGTYKDTSYPNTLNFVSIERVLNSVEDMHALMVATAATGMCALKGHLDRPILNESRAGHTDSSSATEWVCLDVDYTVQGPTPEEFLEKLGIKDVSFIFQKSASMGIKTSDGWRGHFFLLLDSPQSPQALKQWLVHLNLSVHSLRDKVRVSASGGALIYPLDVTTCQNDKLLYIAPPTCIGFDDPIQDRFELHVRDNPKATLDLSKVSAAGNQQEVQTLLTELRTALKLPKKTFKTKQKRGVEVLTNPDPVMVTGVKEARGYVYLNLNGGDSWAYYFYPDSPDILYNFKGEPCMLMQDVDKDLLSDYNAVTTNDAVVSTGSIPFGFLWPEDDSYYRGFANPDTNQLDWIFATGAKGKLKDFFVQNGVACGGQWAVDEWDMTFNPTVDGKVNFAEKSLNTYKKSDYMLNAKESTDIPSTIDRVLSSVCVDQVTKDHFLNWLASIFQTRVKTNTAWIFQGCQGTGKGVLFTRIIAPLLGRAYCHEMTMDRLDDDFNAYLGENLLLFIDEANISDSRDGDRLLNRIKNLITEPEQHIRGMHRNAVLRPNYSNIILGSNHDEIIPMELSDRRFNVAPRQETPIVLDTDDIETIFNELPAFAGYLQTYEVQQQDVKQVMLSEARTHLIENSETTIDLFFTAIKQGNLGYFTQYLGSTMDSPMEGLRTHDYAYIVKGWVVNLEANVSRDDLHTCYQYLQANNISKTKFSRMCSKYNLGIKPVRVDGKLVRGVSNRKWILSDDEVAEHREVPGDNVVAFKEK